MPAERYWQVMRTASRRLSWGIADQGVSSLTNFLLSSLVARSLGAEQFGAFTLAYVTYGFAGNASRGLSIEPLLVRFSGSSQPVWRRATAESTGTAVVVGLVLGICALAVAPLVGGTTGHAFLALGLTFPGLLLQDSWRFAFFAIGRGSKALVNDLVWAGVEIPVLLFLKLSGHANVFWFTLAWGGAACVAAVFGSFQAKVAPRPLGSVNWLVGHRDLGPRYFVENTGPNIADIVRSYSITSILGLVAVGCIQAANVLMGPFKIILIGTSLITIPEGARLLRRSPHRLPAFCAAISAGAYPDGPGLGGAAAHRTAARARPPGARQRLAARLSAGAADRPVHHGRLCGRRRDHRHARPGRVRPQHAIYAPHCRARRCRRPCGCRHLRRHRHSERGRLRSVDRHAGGLVAAAASLPRVGDRQRACLDVAALGRGIRQTANAGPGPVGCHDRRTCGGERLRSQLS